MQAQFERCHHAAQGHTQHNTRMATARRTTLKLLGAIAVSFGAVPAIVLCARMARVRPRHGGVSASLTGRGSRGSGLGKWAETWLTPAHNCGLSFLYGALAAGPLLLFDFFRSDIVHRLPKRLRFVQDYVDMVIAALFAIFIIVYAFQIRSSRACSSSWVSDACSGGGG